jgi:hypothetical protein
MNESQPPLDEKFKDSDDPLRVVFPCAMWLTGFDAPSCSTVYLDKPLRNHTLMQTIARANRVFRDKPGGLVVDLAPKPAFLAAGGATCGCRRLRRGLPQCAPAAKSRQAQRAQSR